MKVAKVGRLTGSRVGGNGSGLSPNSINVFKIHKCSVSDMSLFKRRGGWTALTFPDKSGPGGLEKGGRVASTDRFLGLSPIREGNSPTSFCSQWEREDEDARTHHQHAAQAYTIHAQKLCIRAQ